MFDIESFQRGLVHLSDDALREWLAVYVLRRAAATRDGHFSRGSVYAEGTAIVSAELASRALLARSVSEACSPFSVLGES